VIPAFQGVYECTRIKVIEVDDFVVNVDNGLRDNYLPRGCIPRKLRWRNFVSGVAVGPAYYVAYQA
jgi:hypothetical protein